MVFGIIILSTVAEIAIFGWFSYTEYNKMTDEEDGDLTKMAIITGCSFAGWLILRIFTIITLQRFYTELQDGGLEEGYNMHSKIESGRTE